MKRLTGPALGIMLLCFPLAAMGQHGGHGGGRGGASSRSTGAADPSNSNLKDFDHALAVQATPDQVSHFQTLAKSTQDARKQVQELLRLAGTANASADLSKQASALKDVVEDAQSGNQSFVKSFSKSQKDGLKELTKKVEKADSEVSKLCKELDQQAGRTKTESGALAGTADKLEKALAEFQAQQLSLGKEMGIDTPAL